MARVIGSAGPKLVSETPGHDPRLADGSYVGIIPGIRRHVREAPGGLVIFIVIQADAVADQAEVFPGEFVDAAGQIVAPVAVEDRKARRIGLQDDHAMAIAAVPAAHLDIVSGARLLQQRLHRRRVQRCVAGLDPPNRPLCWR